jgi:dienelactone hydrolase
MRHIIALAGTALLLLPAFTAAQMPNPSAEPIPMPAQPGVVALPVAAGTPEREVWHLDNGRIAVRNVTRPTLNPFRPVGHVSRAAVIIAPGGGFLGLAIESEGWSIARWFANHGITAFVLKYRVLPTPESQAEFSEKLIRLVHGEKVEGGFHPPDDTPADAYADGISALRYVRAHAGEYSIDPHRIGFMGFSAGGFLTRSLVEQAGADQPDFAGPIYPNMAAIKVPTKAPPMFVAIAADDFLLKRVQGFPLIESYQAAGQPVEFHMFASGGHGFGAGVPGTPTEGWLDLMLHWLKAQGLVEQQ